MKYSYDEVIQFVEEEDVKFIRLAFCDVNGKQKNISIMPQELGRAFTYGVSIDASSVAGFHIGAQSDLFLKPIPDTLSVLPWRPEHGAVVRMFCDILNPDGTVFVHDSRAILKQAIDDAAKSGYSFNFGSEEEFYLFQLDDNGKPTRIPFDEATYMDVAPDDQCENVRRDICLTLERMGILPESSHHEEGPGQNEIDFHYAEALTAADQALTFRSVVQTIAARNGLYADFSPKPLEEKPGNGFHVNISIQDHNELLPKITAGILTHAKEIAVFANPAEQSYVRLGANKAPKYISYAKENRSVLIRIPAAEDAFRRIEVRNPDPLANPYLLFALLIWAALDGVENDIPVPKQETRYLFDPSVDTSDLETLPLSLSEAKETARNSAFLQKHLPASLLDWITK